MDPETYRKITYDLTMSFARTLVRLSPGLSFFYISGGGTDSTERGRLAWARVKGKTENDLRTLGFRASYGVRPGFLTPTPGLKRALSFYKYITWLLPLLRAVAPSSGSTLAELGQAMIRVARTGYPKPVLEVPDIVAAAKGEVAG